MKNFEPKVTEQYPLVLYTQPNCLWCDLLSRKLDEWVYLYTTIDIQENPSTKEFLKQAGHTTVPQLYLYGTHLMNTVDTEDMTLEILQENLKKYRDEKGPEDVE